MAKPWTDGSEAELRDLIDDPIARLMMERDGVEVEELWSTLKAARLRLYGSPLASPTAALPRHEALPL